MARIPACQTVLYHHGIKGQKWGIRNGPPYPLKKSVAKAKKNVIILGSIASGEVSKKINREKQGRHIKSSPLYIKGRSYLYGSFEDAQKLVDELSGTGEILKDSNGQWLKKEKVIAKHNIGVHIDRLTGKETETDKAMIVYSKTGTHIYPRRED